MLGERLSQNDNEKGKIVVFLDVTTCSLVGCLPKCENILKLSSRYDFDPEDGASIFLRNAVHYLPGHKASHSIDRGFDWPLRVSRTSNSEKCHPDMFLEIYTRH